MRMDRSDVIKFLRQSVWVGTSCRQSFRINTFSLVRIVLKQVLYVLSFALPVPRLRPSLHGSDGSQASNF